jgi:hypothetical protein
MLPHLNIHYFLFPMYLNLSGTLVSTYPKPSPLFPNTFKSIIFRWHSTADLALGSLSPNEQIMTPQSPDKDQFFLTETKINDFLTLWALSFCASPPDLHTCTFCKIQLGTESVSEFAHLPKTDKQANAC